jgi:hypothetical protein
VHITRTHQLLLLCSLSLLCGKSLASDQLDILAIPLAGVSSENPAKNNNDLFLDQLYRAIEFRFEGNVNYRTTSPNRILKTLKEGRNVTCTASIWNGRYSNVDYYIPLGPAVGLSVIVRRDRLHDLPVTQGMVDLEVLVNFPELKGATVGGRPYPDTVSELIYKGIALGTLHEFNTPTYGTNIIAMIARRRMDYTIDYAPAAYSKSYSEHMQDMEELSILQNIDQNEFGLYCSGGTPADRERISQKLNKLAIDLALEAETYRQLYSLYELGAQKKRTMERLEEYLKTRPHQSIRKPS